MAGATPFPWMDWLLDRLPVQPWEWVVTGVIVIAVIGTAQSAVKWVAAAVRWIMRQVRRFQPDNQRREDLMRFAGHVKSQMQRLGDREEWRDSRYAELEAELEMFADRAGLLGMLRRRSARSVLQRVSSLSDALQETKERIVLLEGEPGSGKSVAMRHLTERMAGDAESGAGKIPIYVNLKTFTPQHSPPTVDDVRDFVLREVNQARHRDVESFLEKEFSRGLADGTWLFLFDSFDEIPEVLSSTEADQVIAGYTEALYEFLHGMNKCRGIVASREFRGPGRTGWARLRVVPLAHDRKVNLVRRALLGVDVEQALLTGLRGADVSVRQMSDNPLFLSLLCEHLREGNEFPTNVHTVMETYVQHRLQRDAERVERHFAVTGHEVRAVAEELAFVMADNVALGLSVDRSAAADVVAEGLRLSTHEVGRALDALVYTKLARTGEHDTTVTFAHRRLQEYFATCVVLNQPGRVQVRSLLTDGRWRETAVTILQTQSEGQAAPLLDEAFWRLEGAPFDDVELGRRRGDYTWPPGALYLLGILAEGASADLLRTKPDLMTRAGALLRRAWNYGQRYDRKWALECCSVADRETCVGLLKHGFASDSEWLRQEAYAQVRRVPHLAPDVAQEIRQALLDMSIRGRLRRERRSVMSEIRRLPEPDGMLRVVRWHVIAPFAHVALVLFGAMAFYPTADKSSVLAVISLVMVILGVVSTFLLARLSMATTSVVRARIRSFLWNLFGADSFEVNLGMAMVGALGYCLVLPAVGHDEMSWWDVVALLVLYVLLLPLGLVFVARRGVPAPRTTRLRRLLVAPLTMIVIVLRCGITLLIKNPMLALMIAVPIGSMFVLVAKWGTVLQIIATLVVLTFVLGLVVFAVRVVASPFVQFWRTMRARRAAVAWIRDGMSVDALRDLLFSARTTTTMLSFFGQVRRVGVSLPTDVTALLERLVSAMDVRYDDHGHSWVNVVYALVGGRQVLRPLTPNRWEWTDSSDVIDEINHLLGELRKPSQLVPSLVAARAGRG